MWLSIKQRIPLMVPRLAVVASSRLLAAQLVIKMLVIKTVIVVHQTRVTSHLIQIIKVHKKVAVQRQIPKQLAVLRLKTPILPAQRQTPVLAQLQARRPIVGRLMSLRQVPRVLLRRRTIRTIPQQTGATRQCLVF